MTDAIEVFVGICRDDTQGWRRILDQERIAHRPDRDGKAPVVVFVGALPDWAEQYVVEGGVAVVSGAQADLHLLPHGFNTSVTGFVPPNSTRRCSASCLVAVFDFPGAGEIRVHEDRVSKYGTDPDRFPVVHVVRHGKGALVASGVPLTALLTASGDRLRQFAHFSPVTERVASVDKAEIADLLLYMLRVAFQCARLPLVVLPRFPEGARSVFLFRVDVDGIFGGNTMAIASAARRQDVATSFYFNGDLSERHPGPLGTWGARTETGQHGWTHTLFETRSENLDNLRRAHSWMQRSFGIEPSSFVAPRGMWNRHLAEALQAMGYRYSSDFGLEYDSLPFRSDAGVLQVPVHPYSPERATIWAEENARRPPSAREVLNHYVKAMDHQVRHGRPAYLYGHPEVLGRIVDDVLPPLVGRAREHGLADMTVGEFADFWMAREEAFPRVVLDREGAEMRVDVSDINVPVDISPVEPVDLVLNGRRRGILSARATVSMATC